MIQNLQKNKKYGAVVSIIATAIWSSSSGKQKNFMNGIVSIKMQENKNMTRDGAVLLGVEKENWEMRDDWNWIRFTKFSKNIFAPRKRASRSPERM